jgi:tRNA1(Val) A37 N6-methylase TrmN6
MGLDAADHVTEDAALGGRLVLRQPRRGHRFGHDGVLLAAATGAAGGDHVIDLGAGVGLAGLALARRVPETRVTLVEIDQELAALAAANARGNGLDRRVEVRILDATASAAAFAAAGLPAASARCVMMNPPFNDPARQRASPDAARAAAHVEVPAALAAWCRTAAHLLAPGGILTLIFRADGLPGVLDAVAERFGGIIARPIHPRPQADAIRVLVRATKGSRAPFALAPGLNLNDADGRPSAAAETVLRDLAPLPFET